MPIILEGKLNLNLTKVPKFYNMKIIHFDFCDCNQLNSMRQWCANFNKTLHFFARLLSKERSFYSVHFSRNKLIRTDRFNGLKIKNLGKNSRTFIFKSNWLYLNLISASCQNSQKQNNMKNCLPLYIYPNYKVFTLSDKSLCIFDKLILV